MDESKDKSTALLALARMRQGDRLDDYGCIGDFHGGLYECDHVSPWTLSGGNVDAAVMIVGQDWLAADRLAAEPPDLVLAERGYDPAYPTNANLDGLLGRHFGLARGECYLTNLFPFVKPGGASAQIPARLLADCARRYTVRELEIVGPRLVVCLGLAAFRALARALGARAPARLAEAIGTPLRAAGADIRCVAHPGALGTNARGRDRMEADWARIAVDARLAARLRTP